MAKIKSIFAQEILDSRGLPTIRTYVNLSDGISASFSVPSGASVGKFEALELRDNNKSRYFGQGVLDAVENVNKILGPKLIGTEASKQQEIDKLMIDIDGTGNKSKIGANAILSVSAAVAKAAAKSSLLPTWLYLRNFLITKGIGKKIPTPIFNLIEGGKHAKNKLSFQEFLLIPASSKSFEESIEIGATVYQSLKRTLLDMGLSVLVADEGGFSLDEANKEVFSYIKKSIENTKYKFSLDVFLGVDVAASSFYINSKYKMNERATPYTSDELLDFYKDIFSEYLLIYMEDPFAEEDIDSWKKIFLELSANTLIVGDDLTVTNPFRLGQVLDNNLINAIIIKPNQIGTITEALAVSEMARYKNLKIIVSHRSGETQDDFVADFAVAIGADYAKFGAPARERIVKYNRLLEIKQEQQKI